MANHSSTYIAGGQVPLRMGNAHPSLFPYEPLPAADGEIIIVAANDRQFATLAEVLGIPHVLQDERFRTTDGRNIHRDVLRPIIVEALATATIGEWFDRLTEAGIACGPIQTIDGGVALAERLGLDPVVTVGEGDRAVPMIRNAISFSRTKAQYRLPPPTLGEHADELRAWLADPKEGA
jgi:crotonobetainyl-CoA:carnitine CoA-transferase CaiB-like acyl-CoA transferase